MSAESATGPSFQELALSEAILKALEDVGYETPSPIQAQTIPHVLAGKDVLGQAQTGTGKTAAFALPLLSRLDLATSSPQVLVLTPTRELALQVAEAFQKYAAHMPGFHVAPVYGGQDYTLQLRQLKRGVHVVVGTPGRLMDHLRRGTLELDALSCVVIDEADEMLRMGFIDDVEWILEQTPAERQVTLFSATMPPAIRRIAQKHLREPEEITIKVNAQTASTIRQRYRIVHNAHKLEALTRILEAESFDGMIVFVRTKTATVELADKLEARGYASAALNGNIAQRQRERTVEELKNGKLDIIVATDVAARGLDVERISHVINYDIPHDAESYVHRIGRTGRAGRSGEAILLVAPREKRMLHALEQAAKQRIEAMELPSTEAINKKRIDRFRERITAALEQREDLEFYRRILDDYVQENDAAPMDIAAALAALLQGDTPLLLPKMPDIPSANFERPAPRRKERAPRIAANGMESGMQRYRIEVGHEQGVKPANIVGAIANEGGLENTQIGRISIFHNYSTIDLPDNIPDSLLSGLQSVRVCGKAIRISRMDDKAGFAPKTKSLKKKSDKGNLKARKERKRTKKKG